MEINLTTYPHEEALCEAVLLSPDSFLEMPPEPSPDKENKGRVNWFDFSGTLDPAVARRLTESWKLHSLAVGAAAATTRSSRLQEYADHLLLGLDALASFRDAVPDFRRIWVLTGPGFFMTFHESEEPLIDVVRQRVNGRIPPHTGPGYLLYELADALLEGYYDAVESLSEQIDLLDDRITERAWKSRKNPEGNDLSAVKRRLLALHRALSPLRDSLQSFRHTDEGVIQEADRAYLRHAADQAQSIVDNISVAREILVGINDALVSAAGKRMNEVMTFLTVFTTFFIPINFIASLYGMNLIIPEFGWKAAYPVVIGLMLSIVLAMYVWFRRKGWL